jgi:HlyD family secretion protein
MRHLLLALLVGMLLPGCGRRAEQQKWTTTVEGIGVRVSVSLGGRIDKLFVQEGDQVSAGDTLAILDLKELKYQLEQLAAGRNELNAQESLFNTQIAQAQSDLDYQARRQQRAQNLFEADVIPRQNLEDSEILSAKAATQLKAAQQNLGLVAAKREQLAAQEKILRNKLADGVITAPSPGQVNILYYRQGEIIPPLGQLAQLIDTSEVELSIYVDESMLGKLKPGMPATVEVGGRAEKYPARITWISSQAEFTPKTVLTPENRSVMVYAVRLRADNPGGILKDGMPADVILP